MSIAINDQQKIYAILEEFNFRFPYLKIEFFLKPIDAASQKKLLRHTNMSIGECRITPEEQVFAITPQMTIPDIEKLFNEVYGLTVEVRRLVGNSWLETTLTREWTLEEHNKMGKIFSLK